MEVDALEHQQREEEVALAARHGGHQALLLGRVLLGEGDRVELDVGVFADGVRVGVVPGVLRHPPLVAHADHPGGEEAAHAVVDRAGREDLAMRGLVGEERELREDDAQRAGDQELEPGVAQQDEAGDRSAEARGEEGEDEDVEAAAALEEPLRADLSEQFVVRARDGLAALGTDLGALHRSESGYGHRLPPLVSMRLLSRGMDETP